MTKPLELPLLSTVRRISVALFAIILIGAAGLCIYFITTQLYKLFVAGEFPLPTILFSSLLLLFAIFILWCASKFRYVILPYRFTIDSVSMTCGYKWKAKWVTETSLLEVVSLTLESTGVKNHSWTINAEFINNRKYLINSIVGFSTEYKCFNEGYNTCEMISKYLNIPMNIQDWSQDLLNILKDEDHPAKSIIE